VVSDAGGSKKGGTGKGASKPTPFKGAVTARSYTPGEWKSLSKDQQEKVRSLRNKKKQGGKPEESERSVDSVARGEPVDTKEVHTSSEMEPTSDAAGLQFGRGAYKKSVGFTADTASPSENGTKKQKTHHNA
jgi:hypothetical protein